VIVANALDNAIEGILRSDNAQRRILLHVANASEYLSMFVENSAGGLIYDDFRTTKSDKSSHGFGLKQMRAIAQKYDGDIQPSFDNKKNKFTLSVMLKNGPA